MIEFTPWPKIARLNRDITITEKIDGTNAAVGIVELTPADLRAYEHTAFTEDETGPHFWLVYAQSRKALITTAQDNFGFARWVASNTQALVLTLGPGIHFGEWWGSGIQRGYGLPKGEKRFSLFNTKRWNDQALGDTTHPNVPGLGVVPVLYEGLFDPPNDCDYCDQSPWVNELNNLRAYGSAASPGFMRPEGIVIYHHAANSMFKITLENDEIPKRFQEAEYART